MPSAPQTGALVAFAAMLGFASLVSLVAFRRPARQGSPAPGAELEQWSVLGRSLGTTRTWFLLGGSVFTAYTFAAVPALVYGVGALGYFAVPYVIIVWQLGYVVLPWLAGRARRHGWLTPADAVRDRFDSPTLALAVAVTGLLATMPYVALQLLGLSSALTVMGVPSGSVGADLAMAATFAVLAVATFRHGLGAPAAVAPVKGVLVFAVTALLTVLALRATGGAGSLVDRAGTALDDVPTGQGSLLLPAGLGSAYVSLAVGSALALVLYPHVLTPTFAARSPAVIRRVCIGLLAWTALLGVLALGGLAARARGIAVPPGHAELALPALTGELLPEVAAGAVLGAFGIGVLVPAAVMSVAAATTFANNVYLEYVNPTALPDQVARVARWVSVLVKVAALAFVVGLRAQDAITLQLLGGVWILQTLPAVLIGQVSRRPHRYALLAGLVVGVAAGTWLVAVQGFVAVTRLDLGAATVGVYAGLVALAVNLAVVAVLSPVLDRLRVARGLDATGTALRTRDAREWEVET
ncbi:MAG: sodium:solute symporter family protein [Dermatophilaceae bacterium]